MTQQSHIRWPELRALLHYDCETGLFTWKVGKKKGEVACFINISIKYRMVCIHRVLYRAHMLAWFWYYEKWPELAIDHINRDKADNRISNLRLASYTQNAQNKGLTKLNTSGYKGVSFNTKRQVWAAQICVNKKGKFLGYFSTREAAARVYQNAAARYFGQFAS